MVKHNNVLPNIHCHKKYLSSSRGPLKVRLNLDQASKKKSRRLARASRAAALAPRPLHKLRPAVRCPTQKYSSKTRLGRGFTGEELRAAGLTPAYARTVGISVDKRRTNRSVEGMEINVARLMEYKSKLVVFPRKRLTKPKAGDSSAADTAAVLGVAPSTSDLLPLAGATKDIVMGDLTDEVKGFKAYTSMRVARQETKIAGYRASVVNRKKKD